MRAFVARGEEYVAGIDTVERDVVLQVLAEVGELLGAPAAHMADPFAGHPDAVGDFEVPVPPPAEVLGQIAAAVGEQEAPGDPALRRLLPDASEDSGEAEEFRRLTEADLRRDKVERLRGVARGLLRGAERDEFAVARQDAEALAAALTDVRLVLAERLGIDSAEAADALYRDLVQADRGGRAGRAAAVRRHLGSLYAALSWLQESLLEVMTADLAPPGGDAEQGDTP